MIVLALLVATKALEVPPTKELLGPILYDLGLNATIGNGNDEVDWAWYYGSEKSDEVAIHVRDVACRPRSQTIKCSFNLERQVRRANQIVLDETVPSTLRCTAKFEREAEGSGWDVIHYPPRESGHSRTSMRCKP